MRGNGFKSCQWFRLCIGNNFFSKEAVRHWHRLPREVMESPCSQFKNHGDVALQDMVSGHGGDGLELGLGVLELFSNINDSMMKLLTGNFLLMSDLN